MQSIDPEVIDQPSLDLDDILDGDERKIGAIGSPGGFVDTVGPSRPTAAAEDIGTNDEVLLRIDGKAWPP